MLFTNVDHPGQHRISRIDEVVTQQHDKWFVTHMVAGAQHRMPQAQWIALPHVVNSCQISGFGNQRQSVLVVLSAQDIFKFQVAVEVILQRALTTPGDEQDIVHARCYRLLNHVLNGGFIDNREHLLGRGLGSRQEPGTQSGGWHHGLAHLHCGHPQTLAAPISQDASVTPTPAQQKASARSRIRERRRLRSALEREHAGRQLAEALAQSALATPNTVVAAFLSMLTEPDTAPLMTWLRDQGCRILVPAVRSSHLAWMLLPQNPGSFTTGALGIREVNAESVGTNADPLSECSLILVPCLAVDQQGRRLGQGGGYYDRVLAGLPRVQHGGPLLVGVCFADEYGSAIPSEEHDVVLDACLTEIGIHRFTQESR